MSALIAMIPPDAGWRDAAAVALFFCVWGGYGLLFNRSRGPKLGLNKQMDLLRHQWMARMLHRDNRVVDSTLLTAASNQVTFFASSSVLVLAGLFGLMGTKDRAYEILVEIAFAQTTSRALFDLKLLLLIVIFIYSFLKFTWALRQFAYVKAMVGAAPLAPPPPGAEALAAPLGSALTEAVSALNAGLRGYYFSLAALTWMLHPFALAAASIGAAVILWRRQQRSPIAQLIADYVEGLERLPK